MRRDLYVTPAALSAALFVALTLVRFDVWPAAAIAIAGEVPLARLWHAVPSYPTMSEVWLRLLEAYGRQSA